MPEVSENAAVFLATSYQAFQRAQLTKEDLRISNSIVTLIFACFYVEESLDVIIEKLGKTEEMKTFVDNARPGMLIKFYWFYNAYISEVPNSIKGFRNITHKIKLESLNTVFPNFTEIYRFRNKISHGKVDKAIYQFNKVGELRQSAKDIVSILLRVTKLDIRNVSYNMAFKFFLDTYNGE